MSRVYLISCRATNMDLACTLNEQWCQHSHRDHQATKQTDQRRKDNEHVVSACECVGALAWRTSSVIFGETSFSDPFINHIVHQNVFDRRVRLEFRENGAIHCSWPFLGRQIGDQSSGGIQTGFVEETLERRCIDSIERCAADAHAWHDVHSGWLWHHHLRPWSVLGRPVVDTGFVVHWNEWIADAKVNSCSLCTNERRVIIPSL